MSPFWMRLSLNPYWSEVCVSEPLADLTALQTLCLKIRAEVVEPSGAYRKDALVNWDVVTEMAQQANEMAAELGLQRAYNLDSCLANRAKYGRGSLRSH